MPTTFTISNIPVTLKNLNAQNPNIQNPTPITVSLERKFENSFSKRNELKEDIITIIKPILENKQAGSQASKMNSPVATSLMDEHPNPQGSETTAEELDYPCEACSCFGSENRKHPPARYLHIVLHHDAYDEDDTVQYAVCTVCNRACQKSSQGGKLIAKAYLTASWVKDQL